MALESFKFWYTQQWSGERAGRKQNITKIVSSVSDLILMLERKLITILKKLF